MTQEEIINDLKIALLTKDETIKMLEGVIAEYQAIVKDQSNQIGMLTALLDLYSKETKNDCFQ